MLIRLIKKQKGRVEWREDKLLNTEMKEETPLPTLRNEKDYKGIVNNCMSMHSIK